MGEGVGVVWRVDVNETFPALVCRYWFRFPVLTMCVCARLFVFVLRCLQVVVSFLPDTVSVCVSILGVFFWEDLKVSRVARQPTSWSTCINSKFCGKKKTGLLMIYLLMFLGCSVSRCVWFPEKINYLSEFCVRDFLFPRDCWISSFGSHCLFLGKYFSRTALVPVWDKYYP